MFFQTNAGAGAVANNNMQENEDEEEELLVAPLVSSTHTVEQSGHSFFDVDEEAQEEESTPKQQQLHSISVPTPPCSNPTLQACFAAIGEEESFNELWEMLLEDDNAHVNHLTDWFLFLCAAILASGQRPVPQSFQVEKAWCEAILSKSAGNRVCPKAFTMGEIVWNCEQCQRDSTCVQCATCFAQSNHEGHNVFFFQVTTSSGGCCDCGDEEAWDPRGFCPSHGSSSANSSNLDAQQETKLRQMFDFCTKWMLQACNTLSEDLSQCNGRFSVANTFGFEQRFNLAKLGEMERQVEENPKVLQLNITPADLLTMRISTLCDTFTTVCKSSDNLVRIFVESLTFGSMENDLLIKQLFENDEYVLEPLDCTVGISVLEALIALDPLLPEINSQAFHTMFMRLLSDITFKQRYAVAYAKTLRETCDAAKMRILNEHCVDHQLHEFGGFLLSIQFLNRPRFVQALCHSFNLLDTLLQCLDVLIFENGEYRTTNQVLRHRVYRYIVSDLKYVLQIAGMSKLMAERGLMVKWMQILQRLQNCDAECRIPVGQNAANDTDEWMVSAFVMLNLNLLFPYITSWMISDLTLEWSNRVIALGEKFVLDSATKQLAPGEHSFYLPLYRFIALCMDYQLNVQDDVVLNREVCIRLAECSMKVLALSSLVTLGAWKRNGINIVNVNSNYERGAISFFARDLDLKSIQFAMRGLGPENIVDLAVLQFGVSDEDGEYAVGMFASLFHVLTTLVTEMPPARGDSYAWELNRLLVHRLADGPQPLHVLGEHLIQWNREMDCTKLGSDDEWLVSRLKEISKLNPHSDLRSATYELLPEMWNKYFDPNYIHQRRERREAAQEMWLQARTKWTKQHGNAPLPICPPLSMQVPGCHPMFIAVRTRLLQFTLPMTGTALRQCVASNQLASSLSLITVQVITLSVHAGIELDQDLVDLLQHCLLNAQFDALVMDGIKWLVSKLAPPSPAVEEEEAAVPTNPQDKMEKKRLRAQEKAMKAMRKATSLFGEEYGLASDINKSSNAVEEEHMYECTCLEHKDNEHATMGFLGLRQTSHLLIPEATEIVTLCGHAMHQECCNKWRATPPVMFNSPTAVEDRTRGEFLCPLCKSVCNTWVPFDKQQQQKVFMQEEAALEPFQCIDLLPSQENEREARLFPFLSDFLGSCTYFWQSAVVSLFTHPTEAKSKIQSLLLACVSMGNLSRIRKQDVYMDVPEVHFGVEFFHALCSFPQRDFQFERKLFVYCLGLKVIQLQLETGSNSDEGETQTSSSEEDDFLTKRLGFRNLEKLRRDLDQFLDFYFTVTMQAGRFPIQLHLLLDTAEFWSVLQQSKPARLLFRIPKLIQLPADYTTLLLSSNLDQPCPHCHEIANHERAVCLVCGDTMIAGGNCNRGLNNAGACTIHAERHGGTGVYFLVQRSVVLFVNRKKSTLYSSLYLDKHGEGRNAHNRGLPMKLDAKRMANVQSIYEQHRVPMEIAALSSKVGFVTDNYF